MTVGPLDDEAPEESSGPVPGPARRHARRLEDKLLIVVHHACDINDLEVASHLLRVLELMMNRRPAAGDTARRRNMENLVAAYERVWHIRHQAS